MALESYLERTKFEISSITFSNEKDNLSAQKREAFKTRSANKEIYLKKVDKGNTTIIMGTGQKIQGLEQVSTENFYNPLETPLVSSTAVQVGNIVNTQFDNGFLQAKNHGESQNFTRRQKYTKTLLSADQLIVSDSSGQKHAFSVLLTPFNKRSLKNKSRHIKDTTHFITFIENITPSDGAVLAPLDVCSLYTNIPQE